jgi:hypothetical protein
LNSGDKNHNIRSFVRFVICPVSSLFAYLVCRIAVCVIGNDGAAAVILSSAAISVSHLDISSL